MTNDVVVEVAAGCTVLVTPCQTEPVMVGSVLRHHSVLVGSALGAVTATGSDDTRTVMAIVVLLAVVGVGLAMLAMWVFRVTRPDRELLAPLEVMGDRTWRRGDPVWQRRRLDEVRPADAAPFRLSSAPPAIDASYDVGPTAPGFEDLSDPESSDEAGDAVVGAAALPVARVEEIDDEDATVATEVPAGDEVSTVTDSGSDDGAAPEISGEGVAEEELAPEPDAGTDVEESDGAANTDDADGTDGTEDTDDTDDTVGGELDGSSSLSDDVSSTPRDGVTRSEFVAASPSADPDATLADLVAAAEEPPTADDGSDDRVRSGE